MTRTRRSFYAVAASYLHTGVALISGLVATPLLLDWLGEHRLGLFRTGQQWLGYALLIGVGLDAGLAVHFARASAAQDRTATAAIFRAGVRAYFQVVLGSMLWCGILIAFAAPLFNLDQLPEATRAGLQQELKYGLVIALAGQSALLFSAFKPMTEADQRGYVTNICQALAALLSLGVSLLLASRGGGLVGQFFAFALTPATLGLLLGLHAVKRHPKLLCKPDGEPFRGIRSFDPAMLFVQACGRMSFISDSIVIALVMGPLMVVPYTVTVALAGLLGVVVNGIGNSTWAALANLHNSGLHDAFSHRLVQLTRFVSVFACALLVPVIAWNRDFVLAWVKEPGRYAGDALSTLVALSAILMATLTLWSWPLLMTGRVRKALPYFAVGLAVNLGVSVLATYWLGPVGPPLGAIANLGGIALWWCPRVIEREFGTSRWKLLGAAAGPWLLAVPYAVMLVCLAPQIALDSWFPLRIVRLSAIGVLLGLSALAYFAASWCFVMPAADRREWLNRLRKRTA